MFFFSLCLSQKFFLGFFIVDFARDKNKTKDKQTEVKSGGIICETWSCLESRQECEAARKKVDSMHRQIINQQVDRRSLLLSYPRIREEVFSFIFVCLFSMNGFADARLRIVRANKTLMICSERNVRRRHHNYMRWTCCSVFLRLLSRAFPVQ